MEYKNQLEKLKIFFKNNSYDHNLNADVKNWVDEELENQQTKKKIKNNRKNT